MHDIRCVSKSTTGTSYNSKNSWKRVDSWLSTNFLQNEGQVEHVSTSEGTLIYEDEQSMVEWEHIDAGSLAAVDLESPCEIVKTDDAVFAVPAVPPLKHTPDEPPDVDLYDLVEQMSYQNESSEEVRTYRASLQPELFSHEWTQT